MNKLITILIVLFGFSLSLSSALAGSKRLRVYNRSTRETDTIFANRVLSNTALIRVIHNRYTMLIYANHTYKSIKLLDRQVKINGGLLTIVQKLYDRSSVNTDSVIVDRQTLRPIESYSDISTSQDSFIYKGNNIKGTMTAIVGGQKKQSPKSIPPFQSLCLMA